MRRSSIRTRGRRRRSVAALAAGVVAVLVVAVPVVAVPVLAVLGVPSPVAPEIGGDPAAAALPQDIVFARGGQAPLSVMDENGSQVSVLTTSMGWSPAWSPDGDRVAFSMDRGLPNFDIDWGEIVVVGADGSGWHYVTNHPSTDSTPAWSPDGDRIAFTTDRDGNREIYVMEADGSNQRNLTQTPGASELRPTWSPDGTRIAFELDGDVWVMGVDGSDRVRLTTLSGGDPAWSPDGARIAFTSTRDGPGEEVYVMDADGSHQTRLTTSTTKRDRWPSWAPDSARIVFASDYHSSLYELYRINVATRQVTRLTSNSAEETEPSWRVLPQVPVAGLYKPVSPVRVIDSRPGSQVGPFATPWGPGEARTVTVVGVGGVTADAEAVVVNVAGVLPTEATHLTLWPAGAGKPKVSNLNLGPGEVAANLATVRLESGAIEIANHRGSIHVVVDVVGFYGPRPTGSRFHPLSQPVRVLDSRPGSGIGPYDSPWGPKQARTLAVAGITVTPEGSTPVTIPPGASAVALNVTGVFPTEATHLTVWPTGRLMPKASSLNLPAGDVRPNLVITKVGDDGQISIFNNAGAQHVVADLVGYYLMPVDQQSDPSGLRFQAVDPVRVLDSRPASHVGPYSTPWGPTVTRPVPTGLPGSVAVLNVTGVFPTEATHLTVWPDAQATRPRTSNLNLPPGSVRPNLVITAMAGGQVQISNQSGEIHVLADVAGYFVT